MALETVTPDPENHRRLVRHEETSHIAGLEKADTGNWQGQCRLSSNSILLQNGSVPKGSSENDDVQYTAAEEDRTTFQSGMSRKVPRTVQQTSRSLTLE